MALVGAAPQASLLLHRLKLTSCVYTAATVVSSLRLLLPHARPCPAVTLFILPHGQVCFRLLEKSVGLELGHTCPQLDRPPVSGGEMNPWQAEA